MIPKWILGLTGELNKWINRYSAQGVGPETHLSVSLKRMCAVPRMIGLYGRLGFASYVAIRL